MHGLLANAARVKYPAACSGVFDYEIADAYVPGRNQIRVEVPTTLAHALCDGFSRNMVVVSEGLDGPMQFI